MRFTMSTTDEKKTAVDVPAYVISQPETSSETKSRKKRVIIAVSCAVVAALVLTAILVGMYLFTEAEKDILKFSVQLNKDSKQDVTSNPNTNTVQYHVKDNTQETWIVNDYNADITVTKVQTQTQTNCYVTPLNESKPNDLPKLQGSGTPPSDIGGVTLMYSTGGSPIKDVSFLSKTARDMCSGVSIYWLYPHCESPTQGTPSSTKAPVGGISKRASVYSGWCSPCFLLQSYCTFSAYYYISYSPYAHYVCVITYHPCTIYYSQYC